MSSCIEKAHQDISPMQYAPTMQEDKKRDPRPREGDWGCSEAEERQKHYSITDSQENNKITATKTVRWTAQTQILPRSQ